ncbi:hypothetical protein C8R47DRAFT_1168882 [Mycena vitilis]|nr:hypothetical protein C8R47DRAFT_1168882 [Mycena vitilis]
MDAHYTRLLSALHATGFPLLADCFPGCDFVLRELPTEYDRIPDAVFDSMPDGALFSPLLLGTVRSLRVEAGGWYYFDLVGTQHDVGQLSVLFKQQLDVLSAVISVDRVTLVHPIHEDVIGWTSPSDALCTGPHDCIRVDVSPSAVICRSTPTSVLSHRHTSSHSSMTSTSTLSDTDDMSPAEAYSNVVRDGDFVVVHARLSRRDLRRSDPQLGYSSIRVYSVSADRVEIIV